MNSTNKLYHSNICTICYEDYQKAQDNACLLLKCGHIFHENCIETWVHQQQNCPICKSKAFIPVLMKDIVTETVTQGIEGAKKSGKYVALTVSIIAVYALVHGTLNSLFPGRWPTTEEEMDAYINEHGVIFDLRKPEGFLGLGLGIITTIGFGCAFYMIKSLNQGRNRPIEVAEKINYIPPEIGESL